MLRPQAGRDEGCLVREEPSLPEKMQGIGVEMLQEFAQVEGRTDIQIKAPALLAVGVVEGPLAELMTEAKAGNGGGGPCPGAPSMRLFGKECCVVVADAEG